MQWRRPLGKSSQVRCSRFKQGTAKESVKEVVVEACDPVGPYADSASVCTRVGSFRTKPEARNELILSDFADKSTRDCGMTNVLSIKDSDAKTLFNQGLGHSKEWYMRCYCEANYRRVVASPELYKICKASLKQYGRQFGLALGGSVVVLVINLLVAFALRAFATWEMPPSQSHRLHSVFIKLFIVQFINTAIIILLLNANLFGRDITIGKLKIAGDYSQFDPEWYLTVGSVIILTMLLGIVSPHLVDLLMMGYRSCMRRLQRSKCKLQYDLDQLYTNPQFCFETRHAQILAVVFVTLFYSAGLPILLPFAALTFFLMYLADKFILLWGSARPPLYGSQMASGSIKMMPIAVVLHSLLGLAMFGHPIAYPSYHFKDLIAAVLAKFERLSDVSTFVAERIELRFGSSQGVFSSGFWFRLGSYILSSAAFPQVLILVVAFFIVTILVIRFILRLLGITTKSVMKVDDESVTYSDQKAAFPLSVISADPELTAKLANPEDMRSMGYGIAENPLWAATWQRVHETTH